MASKKKNHVQQKLQDSAQVIERKLRPVYDLLDYGNYKKALQESEKVLRKHPDSNNAKVLKALALLRLGKAADGAPLVKDVHQCKPSDESTLQVLNIIYKETNQFERIADMYEAAVEQCPNNEEYMSHLFMAHVRLGGYKKQHQTATKLHKLKPDNHPYHYWGVMSLVMQANAAGAESALARSMLLPLAERMVRSDRVNMSTLELNAEVTLLCLILEKQGKLADSLDVIRGEKGKNLMMDDIFKRTKIAELLRSVGRVDESNALYKQLLIERPDNWAFYTCYVSTCLELVDAQYAPNQESETECDHTVLMAEKFLISHSEENSLSDKPQRSPLLALNEFYCTLIQRSKNETEDCESKLLDQFITYCTTFGSKPCCFKDLRNYFIKLLDSNSAKDLLEKVHVSLSLQPEQSTGELNHYDNVKSIQKHILYNQFLRLGGTLNEQSTEEQVTLARSLMARFTHAVTNVETNMLSTDVKICDSYLLLAVHLLVDVYEQTIDDQYLRESLSWLERGIHTSPATHQISLLLIYVYTKIGAYRPIPELVNKMEVKQILYDSVGYVYSGQALTCGHYSSALVLYDQMLKYFNSSDRDITEFLIQSYRFGTFSKVEEFGEYQRRVAHSIQYASAVTDCHLVTLMYDSKNYDAVANRITYMEGIPEADTIKWDELSDNRDIPVSDTWDRATFSVEHKSQTYTEQRHWLRMRNLCVRLVATSVYLAAGPPSESSTLPDLMKRLLADFKQQLPIWKELKPPQVPRFTAVPTRLIPQVMSNHQDVFYSLCELVMEIVHVNSGNATIGDSASLADRFIQVSEALENCCQSVTAPESPANYCQIAEYLSHLSNLTELLSFTVIFAGVYWKLYLPIRQSANPRKKKQGGAVNTSLPQAMTSSNAQLKQFVTKLKSLTQNVIEKTNCLSMTEESSLVKTLDDLHLSTNDMNDEFLSLATKNITLSYDMTAKEITEILNHKKVFLDSLTVTV